MRTCCDKFINPSSQFTATHIGIGFGEDQTGVCAERIERREQFLQLRSGRGCFQGRGMKGH